MLDIFRSQFLIRKMGLDDSHDMIFDTDSVDLEGGPGTLDDDFGFSDYVNNSIVGITGRVVGGVCRIGVVDRIEFVVKPYEKIDTEGERLCLEVDCDGETGVLYGTLMDSRTFLHRRFVNGLEVDGESCFLLPHLREKLLSFWQSISKLFSVETYFISIHALHLIDDKLVLSTNVEVFDSSNRRFFGAFYWGVDIPGDVSLLENRLFFDCNYPGAISCSGFDSALDDLVKTNCGRRMSSVFAFGPRKKSCSVGRITKDDVVKLGGKVRVKVDS